VNEVVVGEDYAPIPYSTGFESGLEDNWTTQGSTGYSRIQVTTANTPHSGSYHLTMDVTTNGNYNTNEAWMGLNLAGEGQVDMTFWWKDFSDETHTDDGVYFSDNGGSSFVKVLDLPGGSYTNNTWNEFNLDVDQLAAGAGLSLTSTFVVKFQQYDNYAITTDGMAFDDISVTAGAANVAPVADANGPYSGTEGQAVSFSSSGSYDSDGSIVSYYWQFGDGATSTAANPSHTYAVAGTYNVTLTVTDNGGLTDDDATTATISEAGSGPVVLEATDFESGWGIWVDGGSDCSMYTSGARAWSGSNAINIQDNSGTSSSTYTLQDFNVTAYNTIEIEFYFYAYSMETNEDFWVQYWDGSSWQTVATYARGTDFNNGTFYTSTVTIEEAYYNFPTNADFRFRCDASGNADDIYIDDVTITAENRAFRLAGGDNVTIEALGTIDENTEFVLERTMNVYPNPADNSINVAFNGNENAQLMIYDMVGNLVRNVTMDRNDMQLDISDLQTGMYFMIINDGEQVISRRFIKQ
jgi:PKD repeat protein